MQIDKEHVDSCGTRQEFPHCELTAVWTKHDQPPAYLRCKVTLKGAKEPYNYFIILLDTTPSGIALSDSHRMILCKQ